MTTFKVAVCTVTIDGYHDLRWTTQRMTLLSNAADELSRYSVHLFCLPGGYFFASNSAEYVAIQRQITNLATNVGIDLLVGLDTDIKNPHPNDELVSLYKLPSFSIFASTDGRSDKWRQRSTTSTNQYLVLDALCKEERLLFASPRIEVLLCGEIFNERIQAALAFRNTKIVIDQAHTASRFRVFAPMKRLATNGISSLCSVHADVRGSIKHCYIPGPSGWQRNSSRKIDLEIGNKPRLEIKIWNFDSSGQISQA
ncbi:MAG: hypothetical protein C0417_07475 [Chlorobiaceae bacterium]|nr:hypothetical protein [Chlorobiaceae bacterium]